MSGAFRVGPATLQSMSAPEFTAYSSAMGGKRRKAEAVKEEVGRVDTGPVSRAAHADTREARALRRSWAQLVKRVYEVDPMVCPSCGSEMKVIACIAEHGVVDAIPRHMKRKKERRERAPPS